MVQKSTKKLYSDKSNYSTYFLTVCDKKCNERSYESLEQAREMVAAIRSEED